MSTIDLQKLRNLIGRKAHYQNSQWMIIEVLEEPLALILQQTGHGSDVQPNQYGEAKRRAPKTQVVTVLTSDESDFSGEFLDVEIIDGN